MIIYWITIAIYLSFVLDIVLWPISSEASTPSLLRSGELGSPKRFLFITTYLANLVFYITPLVLSVLGLLGFFEVSTGIYLQYTGIVISLSGRGLSLSASRDLRRSGPVLVMNSLFRYSRNPISLGMHLTIFGILTVFNQWYLWVLFVLYLINIHSKIVIEEEHLRKRFGNQYESYCMNTPRYLARI